MRIFLLIPFLLFTTACASSNSNQAEVNNLTVAQAQKEIRIGLSSTDVVEILGSPNMITTDDQRREAWVYDKVSTSISSEGSSSGVWLLVFGASSNKNSSSSSQRTLTIIIKFDKQNKVRDFAYRTSSF